MKWLVLKLKLTKTRVTSRRSLVKKLVQKSYRIKINDYFGVEIGYLPEFSLDESASSSIDDKIEIEGGYIAPSFALPINETTKIFTKPGAFWGKITETNIHEKRYYIVHCLLQGVNMSHGKC